MKRFITAIALALTIAFGSSGIVSAISANISPSTQSHAHGVKSNWTLTWGGSQPFSVYFWYDVDSVPSWYWHISNTATTSKALSTAFYPCSTATIRQQLQVYDQGGVAAKTSYATEQGGNPC